MLKAMMPQVTVIAINIYRLSTRNPCEALEQKTANRTTERRLQQLKRLTVVKEVRTIVKLMRIWIETSMIEILMNY
jgi:hypothetical protein